MMGLDNQVADEFTDTVRYLDTAILPKVASESGVIEDVVADLAIIDNIADLAGFISRARNDIIPNLEMMKKLTGNFRFSHIKAFAAGIVNIIVVDHNMVHDGSDGAVRFHEHASEARM